jgi:hypothetical protein
MVLMKDWTLCIVGVESPHYRHTNDGAAFQVHLGRDGQTGESTRRKFPRNIMPPSPFDDEITWLNETVRIPFDHDVFGIREQSYADLEKYGIPIGLYELVAVAQEFASKGAKVLPRDGANWLLFHRKADPVGNNLLYQIHSAVAITARQMIAEGDTDRLAEFAMSSVFLHVPFWEYRGLAKYALKNRKYTESKQEIPDDETSLLVDYHSSVRSHLWDNGKIWLPWFTKVEPEPKEDKFLNRKDVKFYMKQNHIIPEERPWEDVDMAGWSEPPESQ